MMNRRRFWCSVVGLALLLTSCDDDNTSTLSALGMPGEMFVSQHCLINGQYEVMDEGTCAAANGSYSRTLYVANMKTASLAYIPFYDRGSEFQVIDTSQAVPGATSISVGERPHSLAGDAKGALIVLVSSIQNDVSFVSQLQNREIAWQKADKTPRKIIYHDKDDAYYVFFSDGTMRRLRVEFDCGKGKGVLTETCQLSKDNLTIEWNDVGSLDGRVSGYVAHPENNYGFVSYSDRRYISVLGFDATTGECMNGSTAYPCELRRIGAGFGCSDGIDNNGDGLIDSADPTCFYPWSVEGTISSDDIQVGWFGPGECSDGIDNDGDGLFDALDPGCVSSNDASEADGYQEMTPGTCADGVDNDGDGDADRDDIKCEWPTDNEDPESGFEREISGMCRDGIDNDGDGDIDLADNACYGKNDWIETEMTSTGRGAISIDPKGRWLYVLDPTDSQLIVIDLKTEKTIDRSGWYPRHRVVGIPVSRLALDVVGDIRYETLYKKNSHSVEAERAIAFVSSTNGAVQEFLISQDLTHYRDKEKLESIEEFAMRPSDGDDDQSYVGTVRCVGRICTETDLPTITLRQRPAVSFFTSSQILSATNPDTGKIHTVPYDAIINSETWRIEYEGTLEKDERTDGYFDANGAFHSVIDFCLLGAQKGDRLRLNHRSGVKNTPDCQEKFGTKNLEWSVVSAGPHALTIAATGDEDDVSDLPSETCFGSGLTYEIRAHDAWIITSKSTYVNRRLVAGNTCVDDPRKPYGQTRFKLSADENVSKAIDVQTAIFGVKMPANAVNLTRGDAFEFTTRTGLSTKIVGVGAAPTALQIFKTSRVNFLLISEASADTIVIYDIDDESLDDTL